MTNSRPLRLGCGPDTQTAHLLAAADIRVCLGLGLRARTSLHVHDLGTALIATKSLSYRMGHDDLLFGSPLADGQT